MVSPTEPTANIPWRRLAEVLHGSAADDEDFPPEVII